MHTSYIINDLCINREVSVDEGNAKAKELGTMFIETSAKAGINIKVRLFQSSIIYAGKYMYIHIFSIYICMYVCMYVCVYLYTYIYTGNLGNLK